MDMSFKQTFVPLTHRSSIWNLALFGSVASGPLFEGKSEWQRRFLKGFYHIWAWQPSWSHDQDHLNKLSFCILQRLNMKFGVDWPSVFLIRCLMSGWQKTDGWRMDNGDCPWCKLTHEPKGSGELKSNRSQRRSIISFLISDLYFNISFQCVISCIQVIPPLFEPCHKKTWLWDFQPDNTRIGLLSYRSKLRVVKLQILKLEILYYLGTNNKGAEQTVQILILVKIMKYSSSGWRFFLYISYIVKKSLSFHASLKLIIYMQLYRRN